MGSPQRLRPQEGNVRHAALLHHDNLGDIYVMPIDTGKLYMRILYYSRANVMAL